MKTPSTQFSYTNDLIRVTCIAWLMILSIVSLHAAFAPYSSNVGSETECDETAISESLTCIGGVQISLDENGESILDPASFVLAGDISNAVVLVNDIQTTSIDCSYLGLQMITIRDTSTGQMCWTQAIVEDKLPPTITCDTAYFYCTQDINDPLLPIQPTAYDDNCDITMLTYTDNTEDFDCPPDLDFSGQLTRTWTVTDGSDNRAHCDQIVLFMRLPLDSVDFPVDTVLYCPDDNIDIPTTGSPNYNGQPLHMACELVVWYDSIVVEPCIGTRKVRREWTVMDWCTGETRTVLQNVELRDTTAPEVSCPLNPIVLNNDPEDCTATYTIPTLPASDPCTGTNGLHYSARISGIIGTFDAGESVVLDAETTYTVTYIVSDDCGNDTSCTYDIIVEDNEPPAPFCNEIIVSINAMGMATTNVDALILAGSIGANDNCGVDYFEIRKVVDNCNVAGNTNFSQMMKSCCEEIGQTIMYEIRVFDINGNANTCMALLTVQDNIDPIITCGVNTAQNESVNATNSCTYIHSGTAWDATGTDNCAMPPTITYSSSGAGVNPSTGSTLDGAEFNLGTTFITWIADDGNGNSASCTFSVVVTDGQGPIIDCASLIDIQLTTNPPDMCTSDMDIPVPQATDNCDGLINGVGVRDDGAAITDPWPIGLTIVTWTFTDNSMNSTSCMQNVVTTDNDPPQITCGVIAMVSVPSDMGVCTYTHGDDAWNATATDNCTMALVPSYTSSGAGVMPSSGTTLNGAIFQIGTTTITWSVDDGNGQSAICSFDVTVTDSDAPVLDCSTLLTIMFDTDSGVCTSDMDVMAPTAVDACAGNIVGVGSRSDGLSIDSPWSLGTTTITWTFDDGAGNVHSCMQDVVVSDNASPQITCGVIAMVSVPSDMGVCTYTHGDDAWNATATDNCTMALVPSYTSSGAGVMPSSGTTLNGAIFQIGTTTITWSVDDGNGQSAICSFDVTVTDSDAPVLDCSTLLTIMFDTDSGVCTSDMDVMAPTAVDVCAGNIVGVGSRSDGLSIDSPWSLGTTTITWIFDDGAGNVHSCMQDVVVSDNASPQITCGVIAMVSVPSDMGVCTYTHGDDAWNATATDNCTMALVPSYTSSGAGVMPSSGMTLNGAIFQIGTTTITWSVDDGNGQSAICSFDVTVTDSDAPVLDCSTLLTIMFDTDSGVCTSDMDVMAPTAVDACAGNIVGVGSRSDGLSIDSPWSLGTTTITWTFDDGAGNVHSCMQDVVVSDNASPQITCGVIAMVSVPSDMGVCTYTHGDDAWNATATDNCTMALVPSYTSSGAGVMPSSGTTLNGAIFQIGTTTITWSVDDGNGQSAICSFDVTVTDSDAPVLDCSTLLTIMFDTDSGVCTSDMDVMAPTAVDACAGNIVGVGSRSDGLSIDSPWSLGTTTITWIFDDGAGNVHSCMQDVVVSDNASPQITCGVIAMVSVPSDMGVCTYTHGDDAWNATATDNCTMALVPSYTSSGAGVMPSSGMTLNGAIFQIGTTTITWSVDDGNGQSAICSFDVTVTDSDAPVLDCSTLLTIMFDTDSGVCTSDMDVMAPTAVDVCAGNIVGVGSRSDGLSIDSPWSLGTTTITWTFDDGAGNVHSCMQDVVVSDNEDPVLTCPSSISLDAHPDSCSAFVNVPIPMVIDNCMITSFTHNYGPAMAGGSNASGVYPIGTTIVLWTVMDQSGNMATCGISVEVNGLDPTFSPVPMDIKVFSAPDSCEAYVNVPIPMANSGGAPIPVVHNSPFATSPGANASGIYPVGTTTVIFTATDMCGASIMDTIDIAVCDTVPPEAMCVLEKIFIGPNGITTLHVDDWGSGTDNCFPTDSLSISFSSVPGDTIRMFDCDDRGNPIDLPIWVIDPNGVFDTCVATVIIDDTLNVCNMPIMIAGQIATFNDWQLQDAEVTIPNQLSMGSRMTDNNGRYVFSDVQTGGSYQIQPYRDGDFSDGITTLDLIHILRSIIGDIKFDNPYQHIAADVNSDGVINVLDVLRLQEVILFGENQIIENTSWRFVDESYSFDNPSHPLRENYSQSIIIDPLIVDRMDADFVAIKIGDMNESIANARGGIETRQSPAQSIVLSIDGTQTGHTVLTLNEEISAQGFQIVLHVPSGRRQVTDIRLSDAWGRRAVMNQHWIDEEHVMLSVVSPVDVHFALNDAVLVMESIDDKLSIALGPKPYRSELYVDLEAREVKLRSNDDQPSVHLYQNVPNPFNDYTSISFDAPYAGSGNLILYDELGKRIYNREIEFVKGNNVEFVTSDQLDRTGVIYYQIQIGDTIVVKRMTRIK